MCVIHYYGLFTKVRYVVLEFKFDVLSLLLFNATYIQVDLLTNTTKSSNMFIVFFLPRMVHAICKIKPSFEVTSKIQRGAYHLLLLLCCLLEISLPRL